MQVVSKISITIFGVTNPNRKNNEATSVFGFGLLNSDKITLIEGNFNLNGIITEMAPGIEIFGVFLIKIGSLQILELSATGYNSRYSSDYKFIFSPSQEVFSSENGGMLVIDFPPDFLIEDYGGKCFTNQLFSFSANCMVNYNRFYFNTSHKSWTSSSKGPITTIIYNIRNPELDGDTKNFIVYNYDSQRQIVLGRSYSTLNPSFLTFSYDGYQIYVNNDQPILLEVGSYSDPISFTLEIPTNQQLTYFLIFFS